MTKEQREELKRLAGQCICHPVSRSIENIEQAGEAITDLLASLESAEAAMESQKSQWLSWEDKRAALEKDAARYRWLKSQYAGTTDGPDLVRWGDCGDFPLRGDEADEAIDKAMEAK